MVECLYESINKEEGYEANLADITYDCKNFEDRGIALKFSGYSSTLPIFAEAFLTKMKQYAYGGLKFDSQLVEISTEKLHKDYKNSNIDVYDRANSNRLQHLLPHKFHATLVEKELCQ